MFILNIKWKINKLIKKIIYKLMYINDFKFGKNFSFRENLSIILDGGKLEIGNNVFFNRNCSIVSKKSIIIGNDCIFGENVKIYDHNHIFKYKNILIRNQGFKSNKIIIGNNCWIANNVILLAGATIGNNVVVGAGCIINEKIPSNTIVRVNKNYILENIKENKK